MAKFLQFCADLLVIVDFTVVGHAEEVLISLHGHIAQPGQVQNGESPIAKPHHGTGHLWQAILVVNDLGAGLRVPRVVSKAEPVWAAMRNKVRHLDKALRLKAIQRNYPGYSAHTGSMNPLYSLTNSLACESQLYSVRTASRPHRPIRSASVGWVNKYWIASAIASGLRGSTNTAQSTPAKSSRQSGKSEAITGIPAAMYSNSLWGMAQRFCSSGRYKTKPALARLISCFIWALLSCPRKRTRSQPGCFVSS